MPKANIRTWLKTHHNTGPHVQPLVMSHIPKGVWGPKKAQLAWGFVFLIKYHKYMAKQRFYINTKGNDDNAYLEAIKKARELANSDIEIKKVILLIPNKRCTGWFERLFGQGVVKKLFIGHKFNNCNALFKFETVKTYQDNYTLSEIVIICGLNLKDILKIDDFYSVKSIIAIPWLENELEKWVKTWNPINLRSGLKATENYLEPSCIVKKAMENLTYSINMSTGISHPLDEERAKTFILALHKYEPSLNPNVIGAYLVRELSWSNRHAQDIEKLINTLNSGKYFKGGQRTGLKNYYKQWKKECKE